MIMLTASAALYVSSGLESLVGLFVIVPLLSIRCVLL